MFNFYALHLPILILGSSSLLNFRGFSACDFFGLKSGHA